MAHFRVTGLDAQLYLQFYVPAKATMRDTGDG